MVVNNVLAHIYSHDSALLRNFVDVFIKYEARNFQQN